MPRFEIILKNYKTRSYRLFAFFLVCFLLALLIFLLIVHGRSYEITSAAGVILFYSIYRLYLYKKNKQKYIVDAAAFFAIACCWLVTANYLMAFSSVVLGILYHFALQKIVFIIDEDAVRKIHFPSKNYAWNIFNNVILKDDILTLDFINNKLIQGEIDNEKNIDEEALNNFAQQKIASQAL